MLDASLTSQLSGYLTKVVSPIELVASLNDSDTATKMRDVLTQIASLSEKVTARFDGEAERRPSFEIVRAGTDVRVGFAGLPLGHEFTSLVLALLHVSGHTPNISDDTREAIANIDGSFAFETYMSLTCQNCPDVVQALNILSVLNPGITHTAIEGGAFADEVEERNILAVPTVFLNGEEFGQGRMSIDEIIAKLDTGAAARAAEKLSEKETFDVLVVGGGPAGAAAAIYSARKGIRTGLVAERFGGQVADTMGIENLISVPYTEGPKLVGAMENHVSDYDVDVMTPHAAASLAKGDDGLITVTTDHGATLTSRAVIVATGARWRSMGVPGETEYRNKGVTFCPHCDGPLFKGKRVAVIGGGNSGVEAAIDLAGVVDHVTVIEFMDSMRADDVLVRKLHSLPNVDVMLSTKTTEVLGDGKNVTGLAVENRESGEASTVDVAGVFIQIGLLPNTEWAKGSLELTDRGEIVIDERGATSVPGVFAAGDATTVPYKQIVISMGAGATAALGAFDHLIRTSAPE